MELNYPIKYAAMPIYKRKKYGEQSIGYIATECYLVAKTKEYYGNGKSLKKYKVVFPYYIDYYGQWQSRVPSFNFHDGHCTNCDEVHLVYDTYEDAQKYAEFKNDDLLNTMLICLPYSDFKEGKWAIKKQEFEDQLNYYIKSLNEKRLSDNFLSLDDENPKVLSKSKK